MKIRNGFVSNSSSSSFLVVWDKKPQSIKEVKEILFGNSKYHYYYDYQETTDRLSEIIFDDTEEASIEQIKDEYTPYYSYWGDKGTWYGKGFKIDNEDMVKYEILAENEHNLREQHRKFISSFTSAERLEFERKIKLNKVLENTYVLTTREKEWESSEEFLNKIETLRDTMNNLENDMSEKSAQKYLDKHKGKFISYYEYADDGGQSILEHGEVFSNLEHTRFSHH